MSIDYRGQGQVAAVRSTIWDPRDGYKYVDRQTGTLTAMESAFSAAQSAGYRCRIDRNPDGGYAAVEIEVGRDPTGGTDELTNEWFLLGNDLEKNLFDHPNTRHALTDLYTTYTAQNLVDFRRDVQAVLDGDKLAAEVITAFPEGGAMIWVEDLINALALGEETYFVSQFVLRNVVTVPSNWTGSIDVTHINEVYTASQLGSAESIAAVLSTAVTAIGGQWLKKTPSFEQAGRDKWRCEREWWHADVWSDIYTHVT